MLIKREKKSFQVSAKTVKGTWWISQSGNKFQAAGPATKKAQQLAVSRYEQLMAADGLQMLPMSNAWGVDAAVGHVLWCFVLHTYIS